MFWGLIMEPNKRYSQTVENAFHVSMASLDLSSADDEVVQVILCYGERNYLLCSLKKGSIWQVPLDLNFQEGTKIAFTCNGQGHVHLTGYLIMDEDTNEFNKYIDQFEELENEQVEEEKVNKKLSKRKAAESPKQGKELKRLKQQEIAESDDDDDDDLEEDGIDEDDTEDSEDEDDEDDGDDTDEDVEDEEDEDDEDDEEDEEEEDNEKQKQKKPIKPIFQQHEKKRKQVQEQPQQQPQQPKKKHDKQKLTNGKEVKQDQQSKQEKKNKAEQKSLQNEAKKRVLTGGVLVEERKVGNGAVAQPGKFVAVYSLGRLKNGKKIDATLGGEGFKFRLGKGEVIKGWDIGIAGMKVGGKRRITIPPNMAYGAQGSPPIIPGNSTLIFDIELRKVH